MKRVRVSRAAAIIVVAQIGARTQELIDQVAVGGVQLNLPMKSGNLRAFRRAVIVNDPGNVVERGGARHLERFAAQRRVGEIGRDRGAGGNRGLAAQEVRVDQAAHVPQLHHDPAVGPVDRFVALPAIGLRIVPDAGAAAQPDPSMLIPTASLMIRPAPARWR